MGTEGDGAIRRQRTGKQEPGWEEVSTMRERAPEHVRQQTDPEQVRQKTVPKPEHGVKTVMKNRAEGQLIRFALVGILNTAIDFGLFSLLALGFHGNPVVSHVVSYSCGVLNSYFFNRRWTFQRKETAHAAEFAQFVLVNLISLGASSLVLYLLEEQAGLHIFISKAGATLCSMMINFIGSKMLVFR